MIASLLICLSLIAVKDSMANRYFWLDEKPSAGDISARISPAAGYERRASEAGSFEDWLRHLPLKAGTPPVHLYDGSLKINQDAQFAVIDIDIGDKDLQQCADAVIRLRSEFLFSHRLYDSICFNFTSGDKAPFEKWIAGYRPLVNGNTVSWSHSANIDSSYLSFRGYLESVFRYAGSYSLKQELIKVTDPFQMKIGDIFIQGGFPGHAVIIVDMAYEQTNKRPIFMLAQSYMPAQEIHILKNPNNKGLSPWYPIEPDKPLFTPQWTFRFSDLRSFK
jgi:hypothetical protein